MRKTTPEHKKYVQHRNDAKKRNIPFLITFDEWWQLWQESGHWEQYGCRKGQFCMARFRDQGPYTIGNVRICSVGENHDEWNDNHLELCGSRRGKHNSPAHRAAIAVALKGKPKSVAHCAAISASKRTAPNIAMLVKRNKERMLTNPYGRTAIGRQALLDYYLSNEV